MTCFFFINVINFFFLYVSLFLKTESFLLRNFCPFLFLLFVFFFLLSSSPCNGPFQWLKSNYFQYYISCCSAQVLVCFPSSNRSTNISFIRSLFPVPCCYKKRKKQKKNISFIRPFSWLLSQEIIEPKWILINPFSFIYLFILTLYLPDKNSWQFRGILQLQFWKFRLFSTSNGLKYAIY